MVASIGAFTIAAGVLVFLTNFVRTMRTEPTAPNNPWGGATLELATTSPPPEHDFDVIPEIRDRDPLWYDRDHGIEPPEAPESVHIHLPPPSYYPIMMALGALMLAIGPMTHLAILALGHTVIIYSIRGWAPEPPGGGAQQ